MFENLRYKVENLIGGGFDKKKWIRNALVSATLIGAGAGGYFYLNAEDTPRAADYGPPANIQPILVDAARQHSALREWRQNWESLCHVAAPTEEAALARSSRQARELLQSMATEPLVGGQAARVLEQMGTAICINESPKAINAVFIDATNALTIKSNLPPARQLFHALEEARHAVQQSQGMMGSINTTKEEALRMAFALEADATATAILAASRLRAQGNFSLWESLSNDLLYIDLQTKFSGELLKHGDEMRATRAVFDAWYDNPVRLGHVYVQVHTRIENEQRWPVDRPYFEKLPANFFDNLGQLGDGRNYGANRSPRISQHHF